MHCPKCGSSETKVTDTRESSDGEVIKRRRLCAACGYRFCTVECVEFDFPYVIKRDGSIVEFDCEKVKRSLCKAMDKELCSGRVLNDMVSRVLSKIVDLHVDRVESKVIGLTIMEELRCTYPVAYIRFASVYKNFKSAEEFASECRALNSEQEE